jgi:hypothetical protein
VLIVSGFVRIGHTGKALEGSHDMRKIAILNPSVRVAGVVPRKCML